jgi:hypothetical protein
VVAELVAVEAEDFVEAEVLAAHSAVEGVAAAPFEAAGMAEVSEAVMAEVSGAVMAAAFGVDSAATAGMGDGDEDIGVVGASDSVSAGPTLMDIPTTDIPTITGIPVTTDTTLMHMTATTPMDHTHRISLLPHRMAEL